MKKILSFMLLALLVLSVFSGCSTKPSKEDSSSKPKAADPVGAINKIYESIDIEEVFDADDTSLKEVFGIDYQDTEQYFIKYSLAKTGLSAVCIIKPAEGKTQAIKDAYLAKKTACIEQTQSYDILNSYEIAKKAEIYEHGDYVIMLMVEDLDAAHAAIDSFMPKK